MTRTRGGGSGPYPRCCARVLVVGAAHSGIAAATAIRRTHQDVRVRLIDRGGLPDELPEGVEGIVGDDPSLADGFDLIVKSPGVPGSAPVVAAAREGAFRSGARSSSPSACSGPSTRGSGSRARTASRP